jgi:hypothetical protein
MENIQVWGRMLNLGLDRIKRGKRKAEDRLDENGLGAYYRECEFRMSGGETLRLKRHLHAFLDWSILGRLFALARLVAAALLHLGDHEELRARDTPAP